jgi:hypothetical protein
VNHASPGKEITNRNCKKTPCKQAVSANSEILETIDSYVKSGTFEFFTADFLVDHRK